MKVKQKIAIGYIRTKFKILAALSTRIAAQKAFKLFCTPYPKVKPVTAAVFKTAQHLQFELNGIKINGYRCNHPQKHKVLILHGFASFASKFESYVTPLVNKGYEVLAFDAPAHGNSGGQQTNAVEYKEMIKKVIELYGPIQGFIAHSFGGIALSLALEEIPHDNNTKVVLIAPATETTSAVSAAFNLLKLKNQKVQSAFHQLIYDISGKPTEWFSIKRAIKNIHADILWIHDEDDDITPLSDALKVKEFNLPNVQFMITKKLGHRAIYRDASVKAKVINFL